MDKIINARERLEELINLVDTRIMSDIGDFIDNLTEEIRQNYLKSKK